MSATFSKYDRDPEALAWARSRVQYAIDKFDRFEKQARENGTTDPAQWRKMANFLRMDFIGGEGCVVAAFDERRPKFAAMLEPDEREATDA